VIEAQTGGHTLSGYSEQAASYIADVTEAHRREEGQAASNVGLRHGDAVSRPADPDTVSRRVFTFHRGGDA